MLMFQSLDHKGFTGQGIRVMLLDQQLSIAAEGAQKSQVLKQRHWVGCKTDVCLSPDLRGEGQGREFIEGVACSSGGVQLLAHA